MRNTQDTPKTPFNEMPAGELRSNGIGNTTAIFEMVSAKKDGNEERYLFWETVFKTLTA